MANYVETIKVNGNSESWPVRDVQAHTEIGNMQTEMDEMNEKINDILLSVYPVGAIYISVSSTSPAVLFGGTWEQIKDVFLLSAGNTYSAGSTGGEATHTLTIDEMPRHRHTWKGYTSSSSTTGWSGDRSSQAYSNLDDLGYSGGDQPHNNMPPYLTVYMWKRTY